MSTHFMIFEIDKENQNEKHVCVKVCLFGQRNKPHKNNKTRMRRFPHNAVYWYWKIIKLGTYQ